MGNGLRNTILSGLTALTLGLSGCGDNTTNQSTNNTYNSPSQQQKQQYIQENTAITRPTQKDINETQILSHQGSGSGSGSASNLENKSNLSSNNKPSSTDGRNYPIVIYDKKNPSIRGEFSKEFNGKAADTKEPKSTTYFYKGRIMARNDDGPVYSCTVGQIIQKSNSSLSEEASFGTCSYTINENKFNLKTKREELKGEFRSITPSEKRELESYLSPNRK